MIGKTWKRKFERKIKSFLFLQLVLNVVIIVYYYIILDIVVYDISNINVNYTWNGVRVSAWCLY